MLLSSHSKNYVILKKIVSVDLYENHD